MWQHRACAYPPTVLYTCCAYTRRRVRCGTHRAFLERTVHSRCALTQVAQGNAVKLGQAGTKPSASYYLAESRALRKGAGAGCQPSSDPGALFSLALVSPISYSPLESALAPALASFSGSLTDGWTLELWLKSAPIQTGDTADRVLAALVASDTRSSSTTAGLQADWCGKGPPYGDQVWAHITTPLYVNVSASAIP